MCPWVAGAGVNDRGKLNEVLACHLLLSRKKHAFPPFHGYLLEGSNVVHPEDDHEPDSTFKDIVIVCHRSLQDRFATPSRWSASPRIDEVRLVVMAVLRRAKALIAAYEGLRDSMYKPGPKLHSC